MNLYDEVYNMKCIKRFLKKIKRTREENREEIDYFILQNMMKNDHTVILIDVRSKQEFSEGHLLGAINIPLNEFKQTINQLNQNKKQTIIVYCQMGGRSSKAINLLKKMGYTNIYQLKGGLDAI
jgi:rhodanese-related sulfurtransferase